MKNKKNLLILLTLFTFLSGCVGLPVHDDLKLPPGKIEGHQFIGIRYPFKVSTPPHWQMTTDFPDFMKKLGFEEPAPYDNEVTELYVFNPSTQSNLQFDFTPAGKGVKFSQESIEALTGMATGSLTDEIKEDYGEGIQVEVYPTAAYSLKGVQYAAKNYATYTLEGVKREQGWIYGFSEPYQIFIIYVLFEKEGSNDRQDLEKILGSFEVYSKQ